MDKIHSSLIILEREAAEEDLDLVRKKILSMLVQISTLLLETPVVANEELIRVGNKKKYSFIFCNYTFIQL